MTLEEKLTTGLRPVIILGGLGLLLYVLFLGNRDLWFPDELDVGEACRAMYISGDWVVPRHNQKPWLDYPPLTYWAASSCCYLMGGISEFALRLPSALAAIALVLATYAFISYFYDRMTGLISGFLLLTSPHFIYQAVNIHVDMVFTALLAGGLLLYVWGTQNERKDWLACAGGFALFGLAVLAKGPLGLLLPGMVLVLWHLSRREWKRLAAMAPLTLVALVVITPWYLSCIDALGREKFWHEITAQNLNRFSAAGRGHGRPWHYYLGKFLPDMAPWSLFFPLAVFQFVKRGLWEKPLSRFFLIWAVSVFAFLTLAATKREVYLLPAYPAFAFLTGCYLKESFFTHGGSALPGSQYGKFIIYGYSILFCLIGIAAFVVPLTPHSLLGNLRGFSRHKEVVDGLKLPFICLASVLVTGGALTILSLWKKGVHVALLVSSLTLIPLHIVVFGWALYVVNPSRSYRPMAEWVAKQIGEEDPVLFIYVNDPATKVAGCTFYGGFHAKVDENPDERNLLKFFAEHPESVAVIHHPTLQKQLKTSQNLRHLKTFHVSRFVYDVVAAK